MYYDDPRIESLSEARVWDLDIGMSFRGRVVSAIRGEVGLAHHPVALIFFGDGGEQPTRISAIYSETLQHSSRILPCARRWIQSQGLREGDALDLSLLRSEVLSAAESAQQSGPTAPESAGMEQTVIMNR
ncbi:hypothetical protein ACH9EU_06570 [Kocuria sp. M1R5S2]|uniref:hypothetical protein n=1 Tax=Kocuria rhizosphaerae TaxID=3376285 RepID=UPI0037B3747C